MLLQAIEFEFQFVEASHEDNAWLAELGALMHAASRARTASSTPTRRLQTKGTTSNESYQLAARPSSYRPVPAGATTRSDEKVCDLGDGSETSVVESEGVWEDVEGGQLGPELLETLEDVGLPRRQWVWLQRQRVLWRSGRLEGSRVRLLYAAGVASSHATLLW